MPVRPGRAGVAVLDRVAGRFAAVIADRALDELKNGAERQATVRSAIRVDETAGRHVIDRGGGAAPGVTGQEIADAAEPQ